MSLTKRFNDLGPKQKKIVIWAGIGVVFIILVATGYNTSSPGTSKGFFRQKKTREIQLEPDLIQKTMLLEQRRQLESLQETVDKLAREQKRTEQQLTEKALPEIPSAGQVTQQKTLPQPLPNEQPWPLPPDGRAIPANLPTHPQPEPKMIGEINVLSNSIITSGEPGPENDKKKGRTVYLPPSFMEAKQSLIPRSKVLSQTPTAKSACPAESSQEWAQQLPELSWPDSLVAWATC